MSKRLLGLLTFVLVFLIAIPVFAGSYVTPQGPFLSDGQSQMDLLDAFTDYEQLVKRINQIERSSQGRVKFEVIGQSNQGRDIFVGIVGEGDKKVLIHTQQHGNEPHGTEAALRLLQQLGSNGNPVFRQIREELTVYIVPRVNPDGSEPDVFTRENVDPNAPARNISQGFWTNRTAGRGWDINRYHWFDWTQSDLYANHPDAYPENPVPEAVAITSLTKRVNPEWTVDWHNQGSFVSPNGKMVTSSIMWPNHVDVDEDVVNLSKQLCVAMMDHMNRFGYSEVTRYPGSAIPNIARNAYALAGYGSVLVEIRGGIGQKSIGMLVEQSYQMMLALLKTTADGSLYELNPNRIDEELPERGTWISSYGPE